MADENQTQEPGQVQGEEPVQEPAGEPTDKPAEEKQKGEGLLMPFLYALLAAAGAFTLVMIIGIVLTILTRPAQLPESPSAGTSAQVALSPAPAETQTPASQAPDGESPDADGTS